MRAERGRLFVTLAALGWAGADAFVLGQGLIALIVFAVGLFYLLPRAFGRDTGKRKLRLAKAGITMAVGAGALVLIAWLNSVAEKRAGEIIAAVEAFHAKEGRYPKKLDELVPAFMSDVPAAKPFGVGSGFRYWESQRDHSLMYVVVPPFGRRVYSFEDRKWNTLD